MSRKLAVTCGIGFFQDGDPGIYIVRVQPDGSTGASLTESQLLDVLPALEAVLSAAGLEVIHTEYTSEQCEVTK